MSRENVEALRRAWEAFGRGDWDEAAEVLAPDIEWDVSRDIWGDIVGGGHYRGIAGIQAWLRDLYGAWETFEIEAEELVDGGPDQVITLLSARGRGRVSGIDVEHYPAGVGTLRDGKLVSVVWFPTREEAYEAVGLRG